MSGVDSNSCVMYGMAWTDTGQHIRKRLVVTSSSVLPSYRGYDGPVDRDQELGTHEAGHQACEAEPRDEATLVPAWA